MQREEKTSAAPIIDTLTLLEIDRGVDCEYHAHHPEKPQCGSYAEWIFEWRKLCSNGKPLKPPFIGLLCRAHRDKIVSDIKSGSKACAGCGENLRHRTALSHVIERISKL